MVSLAGLYRRLTVMAQGILIAELVRAGTGCCHCGGACAYCVAPALSRWSGLSRVLRLDNLDQALRLTSASTGLTKCMLLATAINAMRGVVARGNQPVAGNGASQPETDGGKEAAEDCQCVKKCVSGHDEPRNPNTHECHHGMSQLVLMTFDARQRKLHRDRSIVG